MTRPTRRKGSSFLDFKKRIPVDLVTIAKGRQVVIPFPEHGSEPAVTVTATCGVERVGFSLRTRDPKIAAARTGIAEDHLQRFFDSLRKGPLSLTNRQVHALAGEWYREFVGSLEDQPGSPVVWEGWLKLSEAETLRKIAARKSNGLAIIPSEIGLIRKAMAPFAAEVLAKHAIAEVDPTSREALSLAMWKVTKEAGETLLKRANGDYSEDEVAKRFPVLDTASLSLSQNDDVQSVNVTMSPVRRAKTNGVVSFKSIVDGWWKEAQARNLSPKTFQAYSNAMDRLAEQVGHKDAARITTEDVIALKDARLAAGISTATVKDNDLSGLKTLFGWAVANKLLDHNPAVGVTLKRAKPVKLREKGFTDDEAIALLQAAFNYKQGREKPQMAAAKRWVPWLCAYTGARVGEVAQLRKQDVRQENGNWIIRITPEAGTTKNKEAREVPLHPHLVEMGFPGFVEHHKGDGHLFLTPNRRNGDGVLGPLQALKNRLAEAARDVVTDKNVAPNHGWRHRFKTVGIEAGIEARVLDAIQGHAPRTVGEAYGDVRMPAKIAAIQKLPRYEV